MWVCVCVSGYTTPVKIITFMKRFNEPCVIERLTGQKERNEKKV